MSGLSPESMARVERRVKDRLAQIDREIERDKHRARLNDLLQKMANNRRAEERLRLKFREARWSHARWEANRQHKGLSLEVAAERQRTMQAVQGIVLPGDEDKVARWRRHITELAEAQGVTVKYDVVGAVNGYALGQKTIEISPINAATDYSTALHELGHCANPCQPSHVRVTVDKFKTVCVGGCEFAAWRFAQQIALDWTRPMHEDMRRALGSYKKYATAAETREIDVMCSSVAFREIQLNQLRGR